MFFFFPRSISKCILIMLYVHKSKCAISQIIPEKKKRLVYLFNLFIGMKKKETKQNEEYQSFTTPIHNKQY